MKKYFYALGAAVALTGAAAADDHGGGIVGVWEAEEWVATITQHGLLIGATHDGMAVAVLQYADEEGQMTVRDLSPPPNASPEEAECGMNNDAVFTYTIDGDQVTFTLVSDPCEGRGRAIDGTVMSRRSMPTIE